MAYFTPLFAWVSCLNHLRKRITTYGSTHIPIHAYVLMHTSAFARFYNAAMPNTKSQSGSQLLTPLNAQCQ